MGTRLVRHSKKAFSSWTSSSGSTQCLRSRAPTRRTIGGSSVRMREAIVISDSPRRAERRPRSWEFPSMSGRSAPYRRKASSVRARRSSRSSAEGGPGRCVNVD